LAGWRAAEGHGTAVRCGVSSLWIVGGPVVRGLKLS
jgi:hypothetical protein